MYLNNTEDAFCVRPCGCDYRIKCGFLGLTTELYIGIFLFCRVHNLWDPVKNGHELSISRFWQLTIRALLSTGPWENIR